MTGENPMANVGRRVIKHRKWTPKEDLRLSELWRTKTVHEVSNAMGRSTSSVWARVRVLSLKRDPAYQGISSRGRYAAGERKKEGTKKRPGRPKLKPGQRSNTWRPIGAERTDKYGILYRKISDTGNKASDWRAVHVLNWEAINGPIPEGRFLVFIDGNRENRAAENLIPVTRAENMRRNSITRYGPEYQSIAVTLGKLREKIKEVENEDNR